MTHVFKTEGKVTYIHIDFADEGVELTGDTSVLGDEGKAMAYLPFFEADLRRNFADLFPQPEPIDSIMGGVE